MMSGIFYDDTFSHSVSIWRVGRFDQLHDGICAWATVVLASRARTLTCARAGSIDLPEVCMWSFGSGQKARVWLYRSCRMM